MNRGIRPGYIQPDTPKRERGGEGAMVLLVFTSALFHWVTSRYIEQGASLPLSGNREWLYKVSLKCYDALELLALFCETR